MFNAIARGEIKAVWIIATNPVVSLPQSARVREALLACPLVIVSDCFADTDTAACADVLLPATGWGEKDGTVTNAERRISRQRALVPAAGEARHDWWIISEVARRLGHGAAFAYSSPADIFREHAALSAFENDGTRAFDIGALAALDDAGYDALQPVQWPVTTQAPEGTARLFTDGSYYTPSGRARFVASTPALPTQEMPPGMPFQLNTGRLRDQWHTMTRTGRAPRLLAHTDAPFVALNPRDAQSLGIREGDLVDVFNRDTQGERQSLLLLASLDKGQRDGEVFVPIHWNAQFASHGLVNRLIASVTDPVSGQPESKFAWVGVRAVKVQQWAVFISREPLNTEPFDFWVRTPVKDGWRTLVARTRLPTADTELAWQHWLAALAEGREKIEASNTDSGEYRALLCHESRIEAAVFAGAARTGLPATAWLQTLLQHTANAESWQLMQRQETSALNAGRIICSCFRVSEERILEAIAKGARSTQDLGKALRCGTNCGSCIPDLRQLLPL